MCLSRTTSSFRVPHLGRLKNVVPEVAAQLRWSPEVDPTAEQLRKLPLHRCHRQIAGSDALTELHEHVDIAVGPEIVPENRAEKAQFPEAVLPAEGLDSCLIEIDPCHGTILAPGGSPDGQDQRTPASPLEGLQCRKGRYAPLVAEHSQVGGLDVIVEQDSDGWFVASVPGLAGCHTQARTKAELRGRIAEAIDLCREAEAPALPLASRPNR